MFRVIVTLFCVVGFPYFLKQRAHNKRIENLSRIAIFTLVGYVILTLVVTLGVRSYDEGALIRINPLRDYQVILNTIIEGYRTGGFSTAIKRVHWVRGPITSIILNILLFIPLGYLVPLCNLKFQSAKKVLLIGLIFSMLIETLQLVTKLGWFDTSDLLHNSLGTMIGWVIYKQWLLDSSEN